MNTTTYFVLNCNVPSIVVLLCTAIWWQIERRDGPLPKNIAGNCYTNIFLPDRSYGDRANQERILQNFFVKSDGPIY